MPIYEYKCTTCGHQTELLQTMKAKRRYDCPKCKKKTLNRVISGGQGFKFVGTGFYVTDYGKKTL